MDGSMLRDAFGHHVWATLRLLDTCAGLDEAHLGAEAPGTFGPILDTLRHLVGADRWYLEVITGGAVEPADTTGMDLAGLRRLVEAGGEAWSAVLRADADPGAVVAARRGDGSEGHAPLGIRLAQALHHGTDHRSQVCTALTTLGVDPPAIDVWDYAESQGRLREVPPA